MKLRNFILAAAALPFLLTSCGGGDNSGKVRDLSEYGDVQPGDSLIYYFGQLRAVDYWRYAEQDTILKTRESRDEYLDGIKAGLKAAKESDAYNQGLYVGLQLAMHMKDFEEGYECKFNRKILINAIADGLKNDSAVNPGEANAGFRKVSEEMNARKEESDRIKGEKALAKDAEAQKWVKISNNVYAAKPAEKSGNILKTGQDVAAEIELATLDGKVIDSKNIEKLNIGRAYPGPVTDALLTMTDNQTAVFYTIAPAVMGRYYERYGIKPDQIIKLTIKTSKAVTSDESDPGETPLKSSSN